MSESEEDEAYDIYRRLDKEIVKFFEKQLKKEKISAEQENYIRTKLTETMRFWREYAE